MSQFWIPQLLSFKRTILLQHNPEDALRGDNNVIII